MWWMDTNGTLVNMGIISCVKVFEYDGDWGIGAFEQSYEEKMSSGYYLGKYKTKEEAEREFAKIKDKLMSQG